MISENPLDKKVFQDELDFKTLENILETLDHVTPKKISRQEFNDLKWDFLKETWEDKFWKSYDLFLPDDLKVYELPAIISRVNKITFWEILPDHASKEELKVKITITINTLLQVLSERKEDNDKKEIQKAIKKYVKLFEDLYWTEESQKLSNENYRNEIIEKSKKSQSYERFQEYQTKLEKIKTREKLDELLTEVEESISSEITEHFDESFFERWVNILRMWMMTISQAEQEAKEKWLIENWYKLKFSKNWDKIYLKWNEKIVFRIKSKYLDKEEMLLRDKIWIEKLKKDLEKTRNSWNQEKINELELKVANIILRAIYQYPYQLTKNNYWYQPNKIFEFKEIYCVWFSLLWHTFLRELWIKHYWLNLPWHSALEIIIWWEKYYFDGTYKPKIILESWKDEVNYLERTNWEAEKIIMSQIYNNKWALLCRLWKYEEANKIYDKAISLDPNNYIVYSNKWAILDKLGKYEEASKIYDRAIAINPNNYVNYYNKFFSLDSLWKGNIANLYYYTWKKIRWKDTELNWFNKEKNKIKQLIESKNFEWLRLYLLELEKEYN